MNNDEQIRAQIHNRMNELGLRQTKIAEELGVKPQSINDVLRGKRGKIPQSLIDILDVLDLELLVQPKRSK